MIPAALVAQWKTNFIEAMVVSLPLQTHEHYLSPAIQTPGVLLSCMVSRCEAAHMHVYI